MFNLILFSCHQETYGEDPYLSGQTARHFITGFLGDDGMYLRQSIACKHFAVYGGPENIPEPRSTFKVEVSIIQPVSLDIAHYFWSRLV